MASGFWSFDHHQIRNPVIVHIPQLQKYFGGFRRGDDGRKLDGAVFRVAGQITGQTGSGYDQIRSVFDTASDVFFIVGQRAHNIYADDSPVGNFFCAPDMEGQSAEVGCQRVVEKVRLTEARLCCGDNADASFLCNCAGQRRKTDADAILPE